MLIEAHFPAIALVWGQSPSAPTPARLNGSCLGCELREPILHAERLLSFTNTASEQPVF